MKPEFKQITPWICECEWDCEISDELLQQQLSFQAAILKDFNSEILEIRMGFKTLALSLSNPLASSEIENWLKSVQSEESSIPLPEKIWQIPVCYSPETGRDLESLANHKNISQEDLISMHSQSLYRIHFFGFLPGFMYLNGLKGELHTARKRLPDREVPPGSVAIGGSQTGIYPSSSPGGWNLIGQTPSSLFDPRQANPVFAKAGERIEFIPITPQELEHLKMNPQNPKFR